MQWEYQQAQAKLSDAIRLGSLPSNAPAMMDDPAERESISQAESATAGSGRGTGELSGDSFNTTMSWLGLNPQDSAAIPATMMGPPTKDNGVYLPGPNWPKPGPGKTPHWLVVRDGPAVIRSSSLSQYVFKVCACFFILASVSR